MRDFTFIDDIVESVIRVFNIGNNQPTPLMDYIEALEVAIGKTAEKNFLPMQAGDVPATAAKFVAWYRDYNKV